MSTRPLLLLVALPLLVACGGSGGSGWAGTVLDSAGIAVVHNPDRGVWGSGQGWTVKEVLSIGETAGDAEYQFGQIVGVDVDEAGDIYVADMQARDIRVYDPSGKYVRTVGRPGAGPGEFGAQIGGVEVVGDELWVPDLGNQRLSRLSLEGRPLGDTHLDFLSAIPMRWDQMPAGHLVAQLRHFGLTAGDSQGRGDPIVDVDADGTFGDTVLMLPPGESMRISGGRPETRLFASEPQWDGTPDGRLVSGQTSEYRLEVRDSSGRLTRIITRDVTPRPVTDRDKKVILDVYRKRFAQQGAGLSADAIEAFLKTVQFADDYPEFEMLALGPQGSIWAQRVRSGAELAGGKEGTFNPQDIGSNGWDVFDAQGKYLGVVTFPERYQPIRVVGDRFYGVARNDLDVQIVKVYQVVTGGGA
jgi:hypothetical protein